MRARQERQKPLADELKRASDDRESVLDRVIARAVRKDDNPDSFQTRKLSGGNVPVTFGHMNPNNPRKKCRPRPAANNGRNDDEMSEEYCPFDGRGQFVPATEFQLDEMSDEEKAAYDDFHAAFYAYFVAERDLEETTARLRSTVREVHEVEGKLATMPKRYRSHATLRKNGFSRSERTVDKLSGIRNRAP